MKVNSIKIIWREVFYTEVKMFKEALLFRKLEDETIQCNLCAHRCIIKNGKRGICRVRENDNGILKTLVYGNLIAKNQDPVEKKPLYHFLPGSTSFSIAMPGCNFRCEWCQNWQTSQMPKIMDLPRGQRLMPDEMVNQAIISGSKSISYTYTEPTVFFEYCYDSAKLAHSKGIKNIYVTNGFMTPEMLEMFYPYLDAANVDIKAFRDETYRKLVGGRLEPVLESCKLMKTFGIWLEITTLIVPGINDDPDELQKLAIFILEELGPETPWHISRFYPQYKKIDSYPTEEKTLINTKTMAQDIGLNYVYIGNLIGSENTYCKKCGFELISRKGYKVKTVGINKLGACVNCGTNADIILQ